MSKHTQGPWEQHGQTIYSKTGVKIGEAYGQLFAELYGENNNTPEDTAKMPENREEYQSNARLIAAAPELLEACEKVMKTRANPNDENNPLWGEIDKLIKKVKGESEGRQ